MPRTANTEDIQPDAQAEAKAQAKPEPEIITVKSALKRRPDGGDPVALWEQHYDHPKARQGDVFGEVYVAGDREVKVAKTPLVRKKLSEGAIVEVK